MIRYLAYFAERIVGSYPFNSTKGFGFIQPDNGGEDAFVHISAAERAGMREIVEGQKVGYELERDKKSGKMSACNLQAA